MSHVSEEALERHVISVHKQKPTDGREDALILAMVDALEDTHGDCREATALSKNRIYDELDRHSLAGELALSIEDTDPAGNDLSTSTAVLLLGDLDAAGEGGIPVKGYRLDPEKKSVQAVVLAILTTATDGQDPVH